MNNPLVGAEKSTAHTASMTPRGAPAMSTAGPKSFDMPRLPRDLVITIGEQLTFEDRMMRTFTCKTLQGILHPSWMRSRLTGDQKQAVLERFEMHESDVYTYCPSCNKLHTNIKEHKQRHNPASPGRIEHEGCAAGSVMPNYTWERDSPVITYQDARMLINYRRYGRNAGMSPDEFYHGSGRNSVFSWANTLDVKYVGDKDLLLMKSFLWMEGPKYDPINPLQDVQPPSPSSEPSLDCHHLCRHVGLVNPSPTTLTLEVPFACCWARGRQGVHHVLDGLGHRLQGEGERWQVHRGRYDVPPHRKRLQWC
ncbi:hypothetical protein B0T11DRAFT_54023 [Plectosphaerella cucumerina]|uniref:F-box domain-containing protein n=1 Tax=Plectosphaerella cucumerina TaxID=40658 RepID=A0A8K0TQ61_9PEZI|nr:hypothetical protein B0T11DRAFT_54023 [Plectosphaerella cucumerina]